MAGQAGTHVYTEGGEWVEVFQTRDGRRVDANGESVVEVSAPTEVYDRTELIDGERFQRYIDAATGETVLYDADGEVISGGVIPAGDGDLLAAAPTYGMYEGELLRAYPLEDGSDLVLDADGNEVAVPRFEQDGFATFEAYADLGGRRCVIGIDADGNQQLYTPAGDLIDVAGRGIDWDDVDTLDLEPFSGRPIAIGDYTFDIGAEARVYLFPNGAQAVMNDNGDYEAVIVPTDAEYPAGLAFFEGTFVTGMDENTSSPIDVFSFPDGQTAYLLDGELVLVDAGLETTYPDGPPVDCGEFPNGNLFVFPDGRQMIQADDGSWSLANLPGIDPYDELVERYDPVAEPDAGLDSGLDGEGADPLELELFDDITMLPSLADAGHRSLDLTADVAEADVAEADVAEADVAEADVAEADVAEADVAEADGTEPDDLAAIDDAAATLEPEPDPIEPDPLPPEPVDDSADLDMYGDVEDAADDAFDDLDGA